MNRDSIDYEIIIQVGENTNNWYSVSPHSKYDAIHCIAGAILAGADEIRIINKQESVYSNTDN